MSVLACFFVVVCPMLMAGTWMDYAAKGKAAYDRGDCDQLIKFYGLALKERDVPQQARKQMEVRIAECRSTIVDQLVKQAETLRGQKKLKDAYKSYGKALKFASAARKKAIRERMEELKRSSHSGRKSETVDRQLERAEAAYQKQAYGEARDIYKKALPRTSGFRRKLTEQRLQELEKKLAPIARSKSPAKASPPVHESYTESVTGMQLLYVKGGCYKMGCVAGDASCGEDEKPAHRACVADFYVGKSAVTVQQFAKFVSETKYRTDAETAGNCWTWRRKRWFHQRGAWWRDPGFVQLGNHPVVCVSWNDAKAFAHWLSRKTNKRCRLPYEAEWEFMARGRGRDTSHPWGTQRASCYYAVMKDRQPGCGKGSTWPVCSKTQGSTDQGLCDLLGNAAEWCEDWYSHDYYDGAPEDNPRGPASGSGRVVRGGSWIGGWVELRSSYRRALESTLRTHAFGFRVVCKVKGSN